MNEMDVRRLGLIFATRTEVEGMKAENELRKQNNESPAYNDADFQAKADELTNIVYCPNDVLQEPSNTQIHMDANCPNCEEIKKIDLDHCGRCIRQ